MTPRADTPTFEHHQSGRLGAGEPRPRTSWTVPEAYRGYIQRGVRLEVTILSPDGAVDTLVHEIEGPDQVLVNWPARPLRSREAAAVRVQLFDGNVWGAWSAPGRVEIGLLEPVDWVAAFVGPAGVPGDPARPPGRVRTEFALSAAVRRARLYISAHGLAEAEINGRRVGNEELTPGWTSYRHR